MMDRYHWDNLTKNEKKILDQSMMKGTRLFQLRKTIRDNPIWQGTRNFDDCYMNKLILDIIRTLKIPVYFAPKPRACKEGKIIKPTKPIIVYIGGPVMEC